MTTAWRTRCNIRPNMRTSEAGNSIIPRQVRKLVHALGFSNSAHPFENPSAWTNFLTCLGMMLFPASLVLMFGRMLHRVRHAVVIYAVMGALLVGMIGWAIYWD